MSSIKNLPKNKWFKSIGWKLTVWYASLFLISILLISFYLFHRLESQLYKEVDFFLADELNEFTQFVTDHTDDFSSIERQMLQESSAIRKHYQMYYALLDPEEKVVLQSSELKLSTSNVRPVASSALTGSDVREYRIEDGRDEYDIRIVTQPITRQNELIYYVRVGMNLARIEKTLFNYYQNILVALPGVLMLAFVGGYLLARRNLKPITRITQATTRITASRLSEKLPISGSGDELDGLSQTFNQMIERLDGAYQKLSQFSADAAHELRTPLTALIGEVEVALSQKHSPAEYRSVLSSNLEELTRLMRLVNNLLLLSQDERREKVRERKTIELNAIVRDMEELFKPVAEESRVCLKSEIPPESLYIYGDKWRMEQVISNLLDNAIRYNHPGGDVVLSLKQKDHCAELIVEDTGIGVSNEEQTKIFDRFYRIDPSRARIAGGSGLGLSIVKSVIEAHNGTITLTSRPGEGSVFVVQLPFHVTASAAFA